MRTYLILLFLIGMATNGIAQPIKLTTAKKIKIAEEKFQQGDTYNALEWYEKAYEDEPDNLAVVERLATIQYEQRDYQQAERWFKRLARRDKENQYPTAGYYLAQSLKRSGQYPEAIDEFTKFIESSSDEALKTMASNEIVGASMAQELEENESLESISNAGELVNSFSTDQSPKLVDGDLYYASQKSDSIIYTEEAGGRGFTKIYKSEKGADGVWSEGIALPNNVNETGFHTVNPAFNSDGTVMFFNRCQLQGNRILKCDIYKTEKLGANEWSEPEMLANINSVDYTSKQPAVGKVGGQDALFFASNRPAGQGGWDIYYSVMNRDGSYDAPVNAGAINTAGDEETPFYHARSNKLYFSSNGHPTLGGYDVFVAESPSNEFNAAENMGLGVNSSVDDIYFSLDEAGFNGAIVSNRAGTRSLKSETCCDDIWVTKFYIPLDIIAKTFDSETRSDLTGVSLGLIDSDGNPVDDQTNAMTNLFTFADVDRSSTYKLVASKDGYYPDTVLVNTANVDAEELTISTDLRLKPIPEPPKFTYVIIRFDTIYYDFDKFNIREDASLTLDDIAATLIKYPQLVVEVGSHTDAIGTNGYNDILAERRTSSAVAYLQEKGVAESQLQPKSYGELIPAAPNTLENGRDYPEGRQKNRRTEIRILQGTEDGNKIKVPLNPDEPTGFIMESEKKK